MDQDTSRKQWIAGRLEYLKYLSSQLHHSRIPMKFKEWLGHAITTVNKAHSKIHIRSRDLRHTMRESE